MAKGVRMNRYSRQMILPDVGQSGQDMIGSTRVLIVGAGGLGVPSLQYLVGAGVGSITLIDPDKVAEHNLHRQPIYGAYLGRLKVEAAFEFAKALNPDVDVIPIAQWLTPTNARDYVGQADIVLDCADSFAVSYILSDICLELGKPLISASALGFSGYVGGFCGGAPSLRAVFPDLPNNVASCDTAGVIGPFVGMLGALQAQMALSHILKLNPSPLGQMVRFNMQGFKATSFRFDNAPEPLSAPYNFIGVDDIMGSDTVIDLRKQDETEQGIVPQAICLSLDDLRNKLFKPGNCKRVVFVCRSGVSAWRAAELLSKQWNGEIKLVAVGNQGSMPS